MFLLPLMLRGPRFLRTPHAGGALAFLCDQESKQRSRRECDSPFPTPVGTENRTFPGRQIYPAATPGKKSGVLVNRTVNLLLPARSQRGQDRRLQPYAGGGSGLTATRTTNRTVMLHSGRTPGSEPHRALRESESSPPTAESRPAQSRNRVCAESYTVPNKKD